MTTHKSMIETAVELLRRKRNPQKFNKIFKEVSETLGLTEEEKETSKSRFYSDLSLSALFIYTGNDEWDLKERQPIELWDKDASYFIDPDELKAMKAQRQKEKLEAKKARQESVEAFNAKKETQPVEKTDQEHVEDVAEKAEDKNIVVKEKEETAVDENAVTNASDFEEENEMMDEKDYNKYMDDYEDLYDDEKK